MKRLIMGEYYEQFYANTLEDLDYLDKVLERELTETDTRNRKYEQINRK